MPLTNFGQSNPTELPIHETSDGKYETYWTIPSNISAKGAVIEVIVKDGFGNESRKLADGKLFINLEENNVEVKQYQLIKWIKTLSEISNRIAISLME